MRVANHQQQQHHLTLGKATVNAAKALGMTQEELGRVIGRDRTSLTRGIDPTSKAGELALLLVRCYQALHGLVDGDPRAIKHWFTTPNRHTGGTPSEQVKSAHGLVRITDYLEAMDGKV